MSAAPQKTCISPAAMKRAAEEKRAAELGAVPREDEFLNPVDVLRCFRATDFADRALGAAIDAAFNLMDGVSGESRPVLIAAHMQASAIAYLAECLAGTAPSRAAPAATTDV